jgi:hypothetical protein
VHIPKGDGSKTRPLGIPTFADKVLQRAVLMLMKPVYEQDFYCSPTRCCAMPCCEGSSYSLSNEARVASGRPSVGLAIGKVASRTDRDGLRSYFDANGWRLMDDALIRSELRKTADTDYENEVAFVVSKILLRSRDTEAERA